MTAKRRTHKIKDKMNSETLDVATLHSESSREKFFVTLSLQLVTANITNKTINNKKINRKFNKANRIDPVLNICRYT